MPFNGLPRGVTEPPGPVATAGETETTPESSRRPVGTLVLVFVFLAAFVLYYFVNWKLLSGVWQIG